MKIEIHSLQETQEFATKMADLCRNKQLVITLDGDLGAGKNNLDKKLRESFGCKECDQFTNFYNLKGL